MNAQKGKFVRRASRDPKLLVNTGSPGYGHVGPYLLEKSNHSSFLLIYLFPVYCLVYLMIDL